MDPNKAREDMVKLADALIRAHEGGESATLVADMGMTLAEIVTGLDNWLRMGGFLPSKWQKANATAKGEH